MTKHTKSIADREDILRQAARMLTASTANMTDRQQLAAMIEGELENTPIIIYQPEDRYPPCDYCGAEMDYMPWHGSGTINGVESRHIHACNNCRNLLPSREQSPESSR